MTDFEIQGAIKSIITAAIASHVVVRQANVRINNMLPEGNEIDASVAYSNFWYFKKRS